MACQSDTPCDEDADAVKACDRQYQGDICTTEAGRCAVACSARASCEELDAADVGKSPLWLSRCWAQCVEPFVCDEGGTVIDTQWVCDAERDCVDGADEQDCEYFECENKQLVGSDGLCDDYEDCTDGSDEVTCR